MNLLGIDMTVMNSLKAAVEGSVVGAGNVAELSQGDRLRVT